jgi:lactoylglutathione lyase
MSSVPKYEPGVHITPPPRLTSPATAGIRLNHLMLRITNPEASLKFYNDCLGMHTIFIFNTGAWTIYYLGPRDVSMKNMGTATGLLELYYIPGPLNVYKNGNENGGEGFGHVGFTVPDVEVTLKRVANFGYKIIKPLGEAKTEQFGVPDFVKDGDVVEGYKHIFRQLAFVVDPDVSARSTFRTMVQFNLHNIDIITGLLGGIGTTARTSTTTLDNRYRVWLCQVAAAAAIMSTGRTYSEEVLRV